MPHGLLDTLENDVDVVPFDSSNKDIELTPAEIERELKRLNSLWNSMVSQRKDYESDWEDAADYIKPSMYYRQGHLPNNGYPSRRKIINETATFSLRTASAGMHSGTTSPARPWFNLLHPDPNMSMVQTIKAWLSDTETGIRNVLLRSNLYKALPKLYSSLILFGNGVIIAVDDRDDIIRFHNRTVGQYVIGNDKRGNIGIYIEEQPMTVQQVVDTFGIDNVSESVSRKYKQSNGESQAFVTVCWSIEPNKEHVEGSLDPKKFMFRSTYWEKGKNKKGILSVGGFHVFSVLAPRWETDNNDPYGIGVGTEAVPAVKSLQLLEQQASLAHEHNVKPNMTASSSMQNVPKSLVPGFVNYNDDEKGFRRTFEVSWDESGTNLEKREVENRIRKMFFEDLFLMIANEDRSNITATEIQARQQERMMALGPVLETLQDELLDPLIDLVYDAMDRRGLIPEAPPDLEGVKLKVEYVSILAQAQKASDVTVLDRYIGSVFNLAEGDPTAIDNIDFDMASEEYATLLGPNPKVQRSKEAIQQIREARAQQQQQQAELEQASSLAQSAKTLSDTNVEDNNALSAVLQGETI